MLLQDLTRKLEELNKQKQEIKRKSKELSKEALENRVLEVCLEDLLNELKLLGHRPREVSYSSVYAPTSCINNKEKAKNWLKQRNPKVHITITCGLSTNLECFTISQPFGELKLSNGELASEHIFVNYVSVGIENEFRYNVMLNIDPFDKQLNNDIFAQAVYNCVKKREIEDSLIEHIKNQ